MNDSQARAICGLMVQKQEALKCIEREIAQQVENKRRIGEEIDEKARISSKGDVRDSSRDCK